MVYELNATNQKSFYGKARVITETYDSKVQFLVSYNTTVCFIYKNTLYRTWNDYSATTMKHINEFLEANNMPKLSKKEWESMDYISLDAAIIKLTDRLFAKG